jgi:hypothetical protein
MLLLLALVLAHPSPVILALWRRLSGLVLSSNSSQHLLRRIDGYQLSSDFASQFDLSSLLRKVCLVFRSTSIELSGDLGRLLAACTASSADPVRSTSSNVDVHSWRFVRSSCLLPVPAILQMYVFVYALVYTLVYVLVGIRDVVVSCCDSGRLRRETFT